MDEKYLFEESGYIGNKGDLQYYGEWVIWETEEEKEDAYKYLSLWKKFMLKKLPRLVQEGEDQIISKPPLIPESVVGKSSTMSKPTLGIKIAMRRKELD